MPGWISNYDDKFDDAEEPSDEDLKLIESQGEESLGSIGTDLYEIIGNLEADIDALQDIVAMTEETSETSILEIYPHLRDG